MRTTSAPTLALLLLLGACTSESEEPAQPSPEPTASSTPDAVSILRPDVEAETEAPAPIETFTATIGFPEGGSDLDADAIAALEQVAASPQFALATPIILRAHSDSAGSDAVNERASEARGLAVAQWLIAAGADPERIEVFVFGEQNPVEPNALPDSSPNEAGRAANRRVEIEILAEVSNASEDAPSEPSDEP